MSRALGTPHSDLPGHPDSPSKPDCSARVVSAVSTSQSQPGRTVTDDSAAGSFSRREVVARNIAKIRKLYGFTTGVLSKRSNVLQSVLVRAEAGKVDLFPVELRAIANALGVPVADLLRGAR